MIKANTEVKSAGRRGQQAAASGVFLWVVFYAFQSLFRRGLDKSLLPPRQSFARSPLRRAFQRPNCVECRRYSSLLSSFSSVFSGMAAASSTISVISCRKSLAFWEVITGFPVVSSISFRVFPAIEPPFCATF